LQAGWYAKWFVYRALRPEAYGGVVHNTATGKAHHPLQGDILNSNAVASAFLKKRHILPFRNPFLKDPHSTPIRRVIDGSEGMRN
jgi:hypothetical protein